MKNSCAAPSDKGGIVKENRHEPRGKRSQPRLVHTPFRYFNSSPVIIRLGVMMYNRHLLSDRSMQPARLTPPGQPQRRDPYRKAEHHRGDNDRQRSEQSR